MIKKLFFLANIVLICCFCKAQIDSVVYENLSSKLILYTDSTFVVKNKGWDIARLKGIGDDTITYGKYVKYKNKSLYLYSHPDIMSSQLDVISNFEAKNNRDSTLTIILSSPFSEQRKEYPELLKEAYFYAVDILFAEEKENTQMFPTVFLNDTIVIKNLPKKPIEKIFIRIYPYHSIGMRSAYYSYLSIDYSLEDIHSNFLSLHVPKFSAYYIYYARFDNQEVEILDNCTLTIDKQILLSKCKGKKFNKEWKFIVYKRRNPYETDQ